MVACVSSSPCPAEGQALHRRNRAWLEAMGRSRQQRARLRWRNALVSANLPLVRLVAERQRHLCNEPFDDLVSLGVLGLIRAVEAFDLNHDGSLSSFAVPYIRGAILHGLRDQGQPLHTPRRLRELHQRATRLQEGRRRQGLPPAPARALASELGCREVQLEEAAAAVRALRVRSLDAPSRSDDPIPEEGCLLDQLAAPEPAPPDPQRQWLQRQLAALTPQQQRLLIGRWLEALSWRQLGQQLGLSAAQARHQGEELLRALQEAAGQPSSSTASIARAAAAVV